MTNSFEYSYEDEECEKTFELTYDFTPGEREVRWGDNAHPGCPAEVDIYGAKCVAIDGNSVPHDLATYWGSKKHCTLLGKWFLDLLNTDKALRERIEELILEDRQEKGMRNEFP